MNAKSCKNRFVPIKQQGFTLIELLVVVLIIGVLSAIALPQYQKAVLRSRFNALMPVVNSLAEANDLYYDEHGQYAHEMDDLDIKVQEDMPDGTEIDFGANPEYAYVMATNPALNNNYIVYQKNSANYPGEIHCEALEDDPVAQQVCESAGGSQNLGNVLTDGYITYVISGVGAGIKPGADDNTLSCDKATAMGYSCNVSTNEDGQTEKQICTQIGGINICRTNTYNEDGSYTSLTCSATSENICDSSYWRTVAYDKDGKVLHEWDCLGMSTNDGVCHARNRYDYDYDNAGNKLTQKYCAYEQEDGSCAAYTWRYDWTYDGEGNQLTKKYCSTATDGSCTPNTSTEHYTLSYDTDGNVTSKRHCLAVEQDGSCSHYNTGGYDYTYNSDGKMTSEWYCSTVGSDGSCTTHSNTRTEYTYDGNGKVLSQRTCNAIENDGSCSGYSWASYYSYDDNGKQIASQYCGSENIDSSTGTCNSYEYASVMFD